MNSTAVRKEQQISVIIPALHESDRIVGLVEGLAAIAGVEVLVVDGDPLGTTIRMLKKTRCISLLAAPGRARQMNAGARQATGEIFLFLHADSVLPQNWQHVVRRVIQRGFTHCGAFSLCFHDDSLRAKLTGWWAGLRSRLDRRPYGDQAHFFTASFFRQLGGYADIPIMEDVDIMGRAVKVGVLPTILQEVVTTSARRYRAEGWFWRGVKNMCMRLRYAMGAAPETLARSYLPQGHGKKEPRKQCLLFFLKYPEAGKVKTRLARDIGPDAAMKLARAMAEDMLDIFERVEGVDVMICYTPSEQAADFNGWLGTDRTYLAQSGVGLGARMQDAFGVAFQRGYEQVVLVGSDIPAVEAEDIRQAFEHLEKSHSCVLGPAEDGGYWLVGFDATVSRDAVFSDMQWSTPDVLEETVRRLGREACAVSYVASRRDVDTLADLQCVLAEGDVLAGSRALVLIEQILGQ